MLRCGRLCVYIAACAIVFASCRDRTWNSPKQNRGALARPNLRFACELESRPLALMFANSLVITELADLNAGISLAIPELSAERAAVVRRLNEANIPVTAWLLLPKEQGYFFNAGNAPAAVKRFAEFQVWSTTHNLRWVGIGLDIEPNIEELQALSHGGARRLIPGLIRRSFDHGRIRDAKSAYQALVKRMHTRGYPVEIYQLFFMADERRARSTLLERLLGTVDVSGDRQCLMLYTSFHHSWGASVISAYGADATTIVVGSTGGDSKLDSGFAPLNWSEFIRDIRAAQQWTNDIGVYSLEGCVRQGMLARLKTVNWSEASPPSQSPEIHKVWAIRAGIAAVLWADNYAYGILALLLGIVVLVALKIHRYRSTGRMAQAPAGISRSPGSHVRLHPLASYFVLAYAISWLGGFAVSAPYWMRGQSVPKMSGLLMFPAMLLGPSVAGIVLISVTQGTAGLRDLMSRMHRIGGYRFLAALGIPPALILLVLFALKVFVSPVFTPNHFFIGFLFGCAAGFFEEIGWTGLAFPAMRSKLGAMRAAVTLGLLWAVWHVPVIDYLGSATPHRAYWLAFFLAFTAAMTAVRVLICWLYSNTNSVLLAQALHASSTGALAAFGPFRVTPAEEALWYGVYAIAMWAIVTCIVVRFGTSLGHDPPEQLAAAAKHSAHRI